MKFKSFKKLKKVNQQEMEKGKHYIIDASEIEGSPYIVVVKVLGNYEERIGTELEDIRFLYNPTDIPKDESWAFDPSFNAKIYEIDPELFPEYFI